MHIVVYVNWACLHVRVHVCTCVCVGGGGLCVQKQWRVQFNPVTDPATNQRRQHLILNLPYTLFSVPRCQITTSVWISEWCHRDIRFECWNIGLTNVTKTSAYIVELSPESGLSKTFLTSTQCPGDASYRFWYLWAIPETSASQGHFGCYLRNPHLVKVWHCNDICGVPGTSRGCLLHILMSVEHITVPKIPASQQFDIIQPTIFLTFWVIPRTSESQGDVHRPAHGRQSSKWQFRQNLTPSIPSNFWC